MAALANATLGAALNATLDTSSNTLLPSIGSSLSKLALISHASSIASAFDSHAHAALGTLHPQLVFEHVWRSMTGRYSAYEIIVLGSFLLQVVTYFGLSLPGLLFPYLSFMQQYKLQPNKSTSPADQWKCIKKVALSKVLIYLPLAIGGYKLLLHYHVAVPYLYDSMPAWYVLLPQLYASLLIEDTCHYFAHRALHHRSLYWIHKMHHTFTSPFPLAAEYAHPIETVVLGIGFFIPFLFFFNHIYFFWAWLFVRMFETIEVHSGYECSWLSYLNPMHLLPFYGGAPFHDYHHKTFTNNYASTFTHWDRLFGTSDKFFHPQKSQQQTKKLA